jgi:hypothetical protein
MKNHCRENMEEAVEGFGKRVPAPMPMVSVKNLSPEFMAMAIRLDVALCDYRDKCGGLALLERLHRRRFGEWDDYAMPTPPLEAVHAIAEEAKEHAHQAIRAIETAKAVTRGDRALRRRAAELRGCPYYRQLDWLFELEHQDMEERRCPRSPVAENS